MRDAIDAHVRDGDHIHLSSSGSRPNGLLRATLARFAGTDARFTLSATSIGGTQIGLTLLDAGLARRVVTGYLGHQYPSPRPAALARNLAADGVELEGWSLLTLLQRLRAAAMGLSWTTTASLAGASMPAVSERTHRLVVDEEPVTLLPALRPDVTFVHGVVADEDGNTILASPHLEGEIGAFAARRGAIVTVERIVSPDELRKLAHLPMIPSVAVCSVSEAPFGSHPAGLYADRVDPSLSYADDYEFLADMSEALEADAATRRRWIATHVADVALPDAYLQHLTPSRRESLRTAWRTPGRAVEAGGVDWSSGPATAAETMIVLAARTLVAAVREQRPGFVFAGIGTSSLATWLARALCSSFPPLISETGMYDYVPSLGDPWLFSLTNVPSCRGLTDTDAMLGALVQGRPDDGMAVLATGQVDAAGNLNTTESGGRMLTGSGGANDVLSTMHDVTVLVPHRPDRLVAAVEYVTSPGSHVRRIVTDRAVLTRAPAGEFTVAAVLTGPEEDGMRRALLEIGELTPWLASVPEQVDTLEPPSTEELRHLRGFDPQRHFLGGLPEPAVREPL